MSYTIVYQRAFIKTTTGILPLFLLGDSNVTETEFDALGRKREVRERHWNVCHTEVINATPEKFLDYIASTLGEEDHQLFKYRGDWVREHHASAWYKAAVNAAQTVETYLYLNPRCSLHCSLIIYPDKKDFHSQTALSQYIQTTSELEEWLKQAKEYKARLSREQPNAEHYYNIGFTGRNKILTPPKENGKVLVKAGNEYISQYSTGRWYSLSIDIQKACVFDNAVSAIQEIGFCSDDFTFVSAKNKTLKGKFILQIKEGFYAGRLYKRSSRKGEFFTSDLAQCHYFNSQKAAQNCAERLKSRYNFSEIDICKIME